MVPAYRLQHLANDTRTADRPVVRSLWLVSLLETYASLHSCGNRSSANDFCVQLGLADFCTQLSQNTMMKPIWSSRYIRIQAIKFLLDHVVGDHKVWHSYPNITTR